MGTKQIQDRSSVAAAPSALAGAGDTYDDVGHGEPALLMVPGWCGDRWVFDPLAERLSPHRRTLVTELPGHGGPESSVTPDFATADVVDDLVSLLERTAVRRVVPVALSHAGWAALELRRRLGPDRVPGLVLLDWMVLGTPPGFADALGGLQGPGWADVRDALLGRWTADLPIPELHRYVAGMARYGQDMWTRAGREIAAGFAANGTPASALADLPSPPPTLHLYAQPADDRYLAAQRSFGSAHPWFSVHRLDARSHFPTFEVPDEMAGLIEEFACSLT